MSTITIRGLSDEVRDELKRLAALNNRSMEAEAREALTRHTLANSVRARAGVSAMRVVRCSRMTTFTTRRVRPGDPRHLGHQGPVRS